MVVVVVFLNSFLFFFLIFGKNVIFFFIIKNSFLHFQLFQMKDNWWQSTTDFFTVTLDEY